MSIKLPLCFAMALSLAITSLPAQQPSPTPTKTFIDYFLPMPAIGPLSTEAWGAKEVGPRDPKNGLEDPAMKQWHYWDGQIIKGPDGKYHLFGSRWDQAGGHMAWKQSKAIQAVSDNLLGPYEDKGLAWPDNAEGKGHNITAMKLPDGRYAVVASETRGGDIFVSESLDGPWKLLGRIKTEPVNDSKGNPVRLNPSNLSIMVRPDGDFMATERSGRIYINNAADGILGPYRMVSERVFPAGIVHLEDPVLFYAGGLYHIVVNSYSTRKAYHLTSKDGITGWVNRGVAFDATAPFIRYPDGTVNRWHKLERPGVYIENGEVKALTFSAIDIPKKENVGNHPHGSKIIVVPFDGAAFNRDMQQLAKTHPVGTPPPAVDAAK